MCACDHVHVLVCVCGVCAWACVRYCVHGMVYVWHMLVCARTHIHTFIHTVCFTSFNIIQFFMHQNYKIVAVNKGAV